MIDTLAIPGRWITGPCKALRGFFFFFTVVAW